MDDIKTLEDILKHLKNGLEQSLQDEGLAYWAQDFSDDDAKILRQLGSYSLEDLKDLREELEEGTSATITIDLTDSLVEVLDEMIAKREQSSGMFDSYEDEDDEDDFFLFDDEPFEDDED